MKKLIGFVVFFTLAFSSKALTTYSLEKTFICPDAYLFKIKNNGTGEYYSNNSAISQTIVWDFGDGSSESEVIEPYQQSIGVLHAFASTNYYTVSASNGNYTFFTTQVNCLGQNMLSIPNFTGNLENGVFTFTYIGSSFSSSPGFNHYMTLNFGDGNVYSTATGLNMNTGEIITTHSYSNITGFVSVTLEHYFIYSDWSPEKCIQSIRINVPFQEDPCCTSFSPEKNGKYWVSGWVHEEHIDQKKNFDNAQIGIEFIGTSTNAITFQTTGEIIDGWQRIVGAFVIPNGTTDIKIHLINNGTIPAYFDDIRVHPFNASMKSYVYDPVTLWLTAELDDNNYATFYEYDKEGQLIRIKKETSRGIMTIQESRSSNPKLN